MALNNFSRGQTWTGNMTASAEPLAFGGGATQRQMLTLLSLISMGAWLAIRLHYRWSERNKNYPPLVPGGLPLIGNLLQLKSKKPHRNITRFAEKHGPIYQLDLGVFKYVVVSSPDLVKEVAVTKFKHISKRNVLSNLRVWTKNKNIVAMADYGEEYRVLKKLVVSRVLGAAPMKSLEHFRAGNLKKVIDEELVQLKGSPGLVNVRECVKRYLFPFVMQQILGYVPETLYVDGVGELKIWGIFDHLVVNPMKSVIVVDWRDFLPFCRWVPNPVFKKRVEDVERVRSLVIRALIEQKRKLMDKQGRTGGFLEHMLTEERQLSTLHVEQLTWEPIIEGSDTSLVTAEWAIYELARNPQMQKRVVDEIQGVVGNRMVAENDLPNLPLVEAILKETLRLYSPIVLLPPREVEEDITIGGFDVRKGWQVLINVYGVNMDKTRWANHDKWIPDRFLNTPELDMGVNDLQLIPFGIGKRRCAGALQATTVVCSFIAGFVQHFQWELPLVDESYLEDTAYLTTQKLHPLEVIATQRVKERLP